jgi:hypothetical protein
MNHAWKTAGIFLFMLGVLCAPCFAINPFLPSGAPPATMKFQGTEWNDDYAPKDIPLTAKVVTKQVAKTAWGGVFEISFEDLKSKASQKREIPPLYFVVTDEVIALLNEEKIDEAIQQIAALEMPPAFEDGDIYGISHGAKKFVKPPAQTTITAEKDTCTYLYSHESGHFTKLVRKKGAGIVEYGQGYGARKDGFRLKRATVSKAGK